MMDFNKDVLVLCIKGLSTNKDKIVVDITDLKEIEGHGWDYTLVYRHKDNPFEVNTISFHNFIRREVYEEFKLEYDKIEELKNKKLEELRVVREQLLEARKQFDDFFATHTIPNGETPELQITMDNFTEYQDINARLSTLQQQYNTLLKEFNQI